MEYMSGPSYVWSWPAFSPDWFDVDWMHACDQGTLVYLLGSMYWEIANLSCGASWSNESDMKSACAKTVSMIFAASKALHMEPPINDVTRGMIRSSASAPPRLRVKAAEARHMLPVTLCCLKAFSAQRIQS